MSADPQPNTLGLKWVKRLILLRFRGSWRREVMIPSFRWILCPKGDTNLCAAEISLLTEYPFRVSYTKNPLENFITYSIEDIARWAASHGWDAPPSLHEAMSARQEFTARDMRATSALGADGSLSWLKDEWAKLVDETLREDSGGHSAHNKNADKAPAASVDSETEKFLSHLLGGIDCDPTKPAPQ